MAKLVTDEERVRRLEILREMAARGLQLKQAALRVGLSIGGAQGFVVREIGHKGWPYRDDIFAEAIERAAANQPPPGSPVEAKKKDRRERGDVRPANSLSPEDIRRRSDQRRAARLEHERRCLAGERPGLNGRKALPLSQQVL